MNGDKMKPISIVFMGTPDIAVTMLSRIVDDGYQVIGVVTQPDKKVGRRQEIRMSEVKQFALAHSIAVYQPVHIREEYQAIMDLHADLIVTCAYGQFVPQVLLDSPMYGSINVHASLLPKLRGGAPIHKAIMYGEKETGMSIMRMLPKMDAGAVMAQCRLPIGNDEVTGELYDRLAAAGADLLSESIPEIINGTAVFVEQDEAEATFAYTISKAEEAIDFSQNVQQVYNHIRSLIPFPVAYGDIEGKRVKFHKAHMRKQAHDAVYGEVLGLLDGGFAIAAQGGLIIIDEIQMEGKSRMDATALCHGSGKALVHKCFIIPEVK